MLLQYCACWSYNRSVNNAIIIFQKLDLPSLEMLGKENLISVIDTVLHTTLSVTTFILIPLIVHKFANDNAKVL